MVEVWGSAERAVMAWADGQGLTLFHFPAQRQHVLWDRGCFGGYLGEACRECLGRVYGMFRLQGVSGGCLGCILSDRSGSDGAEK